MVEDLFIKYGTVTDISIKRTISGTPFAFVEYADPRDAQDAIRDRDGYKVGDCILRVEVPFSTRGIRKDRAPPPRFGPSGGGPGPLPRGTRRSEFRVTVRGLPPSGSWQDLKDHMREAGESDVYRDGTGVVEFARRDDMEYALKHFQNSRFKSHEGETSTITVSRTESSSSRGGYERSSSSNLRGGGDGRHHHHRYSSVGGGGYPGRDYSYSREKDYDNMPPAGNRDYRDSRGDYAAPRSTYDRYDPPSPRYDMRGGRDSYRGGAVGGRRSPSYGGGGGRRSRSRSRSFGRGYR